MRLPDVWPGAPTEEGDDRLMGMSQRRKGQQGELEMRDMIRAHGWTHCHRNFSSGAQGGGDLAHGPEGVHIECKRTERFALRDAWRQATDDAEKRGDLPVVMHRWNGGEWLAILPADELLALLRMRETA